MNIFKFEVDSFNPLSQLFSLLLSFLPVDNTNMRQDPDENKDKKKVL